MHSFGVRFYCTSPARGTPSQHWQGKQYCVTHYDALMSDAFTMEWSRWDDNMQLSNWFRSLLGRFIEERWIVTGGLLSKARVRDRTFNFQKCNAGFTFEITRHPGGFKSDYNPWTGRRIVEKWKVSLKNDSIKDSIVEHIEERPWTENDIDI